MFSINQLHSIWKKKFLYFWSLGYVTLLHTGGVANQLQSITCLLGAGYANRPERNAKKQTLNSSISILLMTKCSHFSMSSCHLAAREM